MDYAGQIDLRTRCHSVTGRSATRRRQNAGGVDQNVQPPWLAVICANAAATAARSPTSTAADWALTAGRGKAHDAVFWAAFGIPVEDAKFAAFRRTRGHGSPMPAAAP